MRCSRCGSESAKPYNYIKGEEKELVYLCDECYSRLSGNAEKPGAGRESLLKMDRRCPSCGRSLSAIRRTGYVGCANCFYTFRGELFTVIDKMQSNILSNTQKKIKEMRIVVLEEEYAELLKESAAVRADSSIAKRLREIEDELKLLGVQYDE